MKNIIGLGRVECFCCARRTSTGCRHASTACGNFRVFKACVMEQGVELDVKVFTDYVQPNVQVAEGRLDANFFQHQLHWMNSQ